DKHASEPFFLYLAFNAVHTPMQATEKYLDRFPSVKDKQRQTYAAMLSAMDDAIGRVLAKLREKGLEDDTLIFFFSDNGGPTMIAPHEMLYWRFGDQLAARKGDWKMVRHDKTGIHLYNLKDDIGESKNLAEKHPDVLRGIHDAWKEWDRGNVAPLWGGGKKA